MIGINVKEMLAVSLARLHEIANNNPEQQISTEAFPSLNEIALLAKNIAEQYMSDIGQSFPKQ